MATNYHMVRIARLCMLALLIVTSSGCAMLRIGYGKLETLASWKADEYFDLDPIQKHDFRARFEPLHEWHRREQLPEYSAFLTEAKSRLQKSPARADVEWFVDGFERRYRALVRRANGDAAALLATLKPDQIENLQKQWERDNRRYTREHKLSSGPEERRRARAERNLDQVREWAGSLTYEQEQRINALSNELPMINHLRLENRMRRQREFKQLLDGRASPEFAQKLQNWLLDWETGRAPEYVRVEAEWWNKRVDFFLTVHQLLTPPQRAIVARRLQNYIDDFDHLAQR